MNKAEIVISLTVRRKEDNDIDTVLSITPKTEDKNINLLALLLHAGIRDKVDEMHADFQQFKQKHERDKKGTTGPARPSSPA